MRALLAILGLALVLAGAGFGIYISFSNPDATQRRLLIDHPIEIVLSVMVFITGAGLIRLSFKD